jgi:NAD-dependent DNA ligase
MNCLSSVAATCGEKLKRANKLGVAVLDEATFIELVRS